MVCDCSLAIPGEVGSLSAFRNGSHFTPACVCQRAFLLKQSIGQSGMEACVSVSYWPRNKFPRALVQADVLLAVEALDHAFRGNMSRVCLIAGDLDFALKHRIRRSDPGALVLACSLGMRRKLEDLPFRSSGEPPSHEPVPDLPSEILCSPPYNFRGIEFLSNGPYCSV
jgi:hypothetical protein